ncbi:MAG: hypothetical protein B7Z55_04355, partial [Planctomycetales bacterium 12-60-4]
EDEIFDRVEGRMVRRVLTISGSDRYGLPTATDDDVLLACLQLTKLQDFESPVVNFSRYELLKMLRLADDTRNYYRLAQSLRRWKGLSIYSDRAFYDHQEKSWVNRDFGVFDTLYIYHREIHQGAQATGASRFTWNEVLFSSFRAGYLKRLDWGLYTRLQCPMAKRLYRFLDKRFYHGNTVEIDLRELAFHKVRLSQSYNIAHMKRALVKGIAELEQEWELKAIPTEKRFEKRGKGNWIVRFERKAKRKLPDVPPAIKSFDSNPIDLGNLECALTRRGIGPASANELAEGCATDTLQTMIELFDWYNNNGQSRGAGFLVQAIRNPSTIQFPKGFTSSVQTAARKSAEESRIASARDDQTRREREVRSREDHRTEAFLAFWRTLAPQKQQDFESQAVALADSTKRDGYLRSEGKGGQLFEHYRFAILRDHFERRYR